MVKVYIREEVDDAKDFDAHADDGPAKQHQHHAAQKAGRAATALPEEQSRVLQTDDQHHARHEENLSRAPNARGKRLGFWTFKLKTIDFKGMKIIHTFPSAKSAVSKKSITPRKRNKAPNAVRPTPISVNTNGRK